MHAPSWQRILAGLLAGVALGLFLGDRVRFLQQVADAFVRLLQMAVLPYVTVSIVASIGALRVEDLRRIGTRTVLVLAGLWSLALAGTFLMPLTFPAVRTGRLFSTTLLEQRPPIDLVDLYIPANPFFALANNIVPAVVVFSMVVGVALIGVPKRHVLLEVLETASAALARVMRFIVRLTPYGLCAIAATTAGTFRVDQAQRLELYLIAYGTFATLLAMWVLPGLVGALTPIPARLVVGRTRDAVITAAVAGDLFIVLPALVAACTELLVERARVDEAGRLLPDVIVPASFNFPHSGKLLSVSFVLFAGWFSGASVPVSSYPQLAATAVVTLFGSVNAAIPFLLDVAHVPADTFQLFIASGVLNSRFGAMVAAAHTVAMALLGTCAVTGTLRWQLRPIVRYATLTLVLAAVAIAGVRAAGVWLIDDTVAPDLLDTMRLDVRAETAPPGEPAALPAPGQRLAAIRAAGLLRACYLEDAAPFAFTNAQGDLVGFDIALLHRLALELGTRVAFVPVPRDWLDQPDVTSALAAGRCDVMAGGIAITTGRAGSMPMTTPYADETVALIVSDERRGEFSTWNQIRDAGPIAIAVLDLPYYVDQLRARLPEARLQRVATPSGLFAATNVEARMLTAERGAAWTLRHPQDAVVVPQPDPIHVPLAMATPPGDPELLAFLNTWLDLKRRDATIDRLSRYWIQGRDLAPPPPRWSIIRDVLHWTR